MANASGYPMLIISVREHAYFEPNGYNCTSTTMGVFRKSEERLTSQPDGNLRLSLTITIPQ